MTIRAYIILSLLIILSFMGFSLGTSLQAQSLLDADLYFPLAVGNSWTYQDSATWWMDTTQNQIVGTVYMDGYLTYLMVDISEDEYSDTSYVQSRDDGIYILFSFGDEDSAVSPPGGGRKDDDYMFFRMLPNPFEIGQIWTVMEMESIWTEGTMVFHQYMLLMGEAMGLETVTVPAGTFHNCLRIEIFGEFSFFVTMDSDTLYNESDSIIRYPDWLAPGIGLVKGIEEADADDEMISTLLEYDLTGIDEENPRPLNYAISVYPNPFNSGCIIIAPPQSILRIVDLQGKLIEAESQIQGQGQYHWNPPRSLPSGVYFAQVKFQQKEYSKKLIYLK
ncbi:T9SS type A sorting domain-containing protein [bacterium]|nr:T9SS type A sorting domain-containing protein [bacterium]